MIPYSWQPRSPARIGQGKLLVDFLTLFWGLLFGSNNWKKPNLYLLFDNYNRDSFLNFTLGFVLIRSNLP
jgi:hypothetical protein